MWLWGRWALGLAGAGVLCGALAVLGGEGTFPLAAGLRERLIGAGWSSAGIVEWRAQQAAGSLDRAGQFRAVEIYRSLVLRDAANPYRWCDWAEALQAAGLVEEARKAFGEARVLGPAIPPVLVRAGNFYYATQDRKAAVEAYASVLRLTHEYDPIIFLTLRRLGLEAGDITATVLPKDSETAKNFLDFSIRSGDVGDTNAVWKWSVKEGLGSDRLGTQYVDFLLKQGQGSGAVSAWALYTGNRREDYPEGNLVFNSRFRFEPSGSRLDWHMEAIDGVETEIERQGGARALHIRFAGQANVAYRHVWQHVWIPPGNYRIRAHVKSSELTTNSGVRIHLSDPVGHKFDWLSEPVLGTNTWYWIEGEVTVPVCPFALLEIVRQPSEKFDNKISGSVDFDDISILRQVWKAGR